MTYSKLFGVYFSETVGSSSPSIIARSYHPCFIVQTSTAIASIDDTLTMFTSIQAFKTVAENKGLAKTIEFIEAIMNDYQSETFYVFSVKTDTAAAFTAMIKGTANKEDIKEFVLVEETASANSNTLNSKIAAIVTGLNDNYEKGVFRTCDVIPYGTVKAAVDGMAEGARAEAVAITAMTGALTGISSGRISLMCPDSAYVGLMTGRVLSTEYNREAGYTVLNITDPLDFDFTYDEMLTLQNAGICFVKQELVQGTPQYRIHAGLTAGFASDTADGFIKARKTCDEVLRQVKEACNMYYKNEDVDVSKTELQTECNTIVDEFITEGDIKKTLKIGTTTYTSALTVTVEGRLGIGITGTLIPSGSSMVINVNTTIQ